LLKRDIDLALKSLLGFRETIVKSRSPSCDVMISFILFPSF